MSPKLARIEIPRAERLVARPSLDQLFAGVQDKAMRNERIHGAMRVHEYTPKELSQYLGLHDSTISVIAKQVDDQLKHQQ